MRAASVRKRPLVQVVRPMATSSAGFEGDGRRVNIYTDYTVYKGRGAMTVKVIKPTWERTPTGSGLKIARDGTLLLEFANSRGEREYDWENKETFALSAVECAEILELAESGGEKQFFHDPNKFGSGEGTITKNLRISPARDTGFFFSLSVNNKIAGNQVKYDTVVSPGELRVIRTIMNFAIPRILGFDEVFAGTPEIREGMPSAPETGSGPPF
ncbi:hypothetical protein Ndes2526B_g03107 [Nannochloris sp. 'desiccata']|nr:hypothetical protein KSW81_006656 [Chlorella desiccata (nom. nud.)]KAH7622283.1 putative Single-stranded DNA-binding protein WHY2, mitochondrial [Chlorella desiccata (nom. nud.)]